MIALVALLVPHGHSTDAPAWMAILPAFFVGLLVPFSLLPLLPVLSLGHTPEAPSLAPSFQRPPPSAFPTRLDSSVSPDLAVRAAVSL